MNREYIEVYKGYEVKPDSVNPTSYIIVTAGKGGKIPNVMNGLFTSRGYARTIIDNYLGMKEAANAKTESTS